MAEALQAPLYKFTSLPNVQKTSVQDAYFGAQAQRNRRQSLMDKAYEDVTVGKTNLDEFQSIASRVLGSAVGLPERLESISQADQGLRKVVNTEYNTLTDQYNQGRIAYEDYIGRVRGLGNKLLTNVASNPDYVAPTNPIDEFKLGDQGYTVREILQGVESNYRVQQENKAADDYSKGKSTFEQYASFLKNQLNFYPETTQQNQDLKIAWEDAYATELNRYFNEVKGRYDAGQLTEPEYAQFLDWYQREVDQGARQVTAFNEFNYDPTLPPGNLTQGPLPPETLRTVQEQMRTNAGASSAVYKPKKKKNKK